MLDGAASEVVQTRYLDVRASAKRIFGIGDGSTHEALGATPAAHGAKRSLRQWAVDTGYVLAGYPDAIVGWLPYGRRAIGALLRSGRYDAVLSSSPPFTTNVMLGSLHLNIPWVADFRDLWADTDAHTSPIRRWLDARLEHWSLSRAAALTTISEPMAVSLRRRHPNVAVEVVPNAFDELEWSAYPFERNEHCTILYAGTFHAGRRDPSLLFSTLRAMLDRGVLHERDIRVDIYAPAEAWLRSLLEQHRLGNIVRVRGTVSRESVMKAERQADRLLVILWDGPGSEGTLTGKVFEYLGARRRIVAIGGPEHSSIDDLLLTTGSGRRYRSAEELEREIAEAIAEHRDGAVSIIDPSSVASYEAKAMARRFAEILDGVVRRGPLSRSSTQAARTFP